MAKAAKGEEDDSDDHWDDGRTRDTEDSLLDMNVPEFEEGTIFTLLSVDFGHCDCNKVIIVYGYMYSLVLKALQHQALTSLNIQSEALAQL